MDGYCEEKKLTIPYRSARHPTEKTKKCEKPLKRFFFVLTAVFLV
jgi:hypothetical protein